MLPKPRLLFTIVLICFLFSREKLSAQQPDETYNQKIKEYTTDTRFLPSSVLDVMSDPKIPSPLKYFGQIIGAPGVMHHTAEIYNYFKKLDESSPLLSMQQVGTTEEG